MKHVDDAHCQIKSNDKTTGIYSFLRICTNGYVNLICGGLRFPSLFSKLLYHLIIDIECSLIIIPKNFAAVASRALDRGIFKFVKFT